MHVLLLHPVARWSLDRVAAVCGREGWALTIVTIESSTVGDGAAALHEWIRVPALSDDPGVLLSQIGTRRFDVVAAGNEFAVTAADVLARELGVYHNDVDGIRASRNKALMREAFDRAGVPQPRTLARLRTAGQGRELDWSAMPFPVVVKPVDMAMSLFVRRCDTRAEAVDTLTRMSAFTKSRLTNYPFDPGALVEEYAPGPEFSFECVVRDGRVVAHTLTRKLVSPLPACYEVGHVAGTQIPPRHRETLPAAAERIAASWGMPQGVMHVELKMTGERFSIIEAAARPAGGHIPEIVELQHGWSLEEAYLYARAGLPWKPAAEPAPGVWHAIRFDFEERPPAGLPGSVEVVRAVADAEGVVAGAEPFSVNSRTGYSVLRGTSPDELDGFLRVEEA